MEGQFGHLAKLHVKEGATAVYAIAQIDTPPGSKNAHPRLISRPATKENKPYWNRVAKRATKNAKNYRSGRSPQEVLEANREEDLELFPAHVTIGWEDVYDQNDKPVPFSQRNARAFLEALPDYIFDRYRDWAGEESNFLSEDMPSALEVAEQTGN